MCQCWNNTVRLGKNCQTHNMKKNCPCVMSVKLQEIIINSLLQETYSFTTQLSISHQKPSLYFTCTNKFSNCIHRRSPWFVCDKSKFTKVSSLGALCQLNFLCWVILTEKHSSMITYAWT